MALNPKGVREMKVVIFNQKINLLFLIYVLTVSCKLLVTLVDTFSNNFRFCHSYRLCYLWLLLHMG